MDKSKDYMVHIKIYYRNGGHKYANIFKTKDYEFGRQIGSITGYRHMNLLERFIFRNCI